MTRVLLHPLAEKDFAEAFDWYTERSSQAALAFDQELADAMERIAADPDRHPRFDARHQFCLLKRFPYLIVFRRRDEFVIVVAVAHGRRRTYWKRRT